MQLLLYLVVSLVAALPQSGQTATGDQVQRNVQNVDVRPGQSINATITGNVADGNSTQINQINFNTLNQNNTIYNKTVVENIINNYQQLVLAATQPG